MKYYEEDILMHHKILGQKWGIRRYQNKDGSLTEEGRERYEYAKEKVSKSEKSLSNYIANEKKQKGFLPLMSILIQ